MKKLITTLIVSILASTQVYAEETIPNVNAWTQCGIGAMLFNSDGNGSTVGSVISNIIWDLGTTAVSSNASSQENCTGIKRDVALFIDRTYPQLEQETAQAQGENLTAMLDLYECDLSSRQNITNSIRNNFNTIVSNSSYQNLNHNEKAYSYYQNVDQVISSSFSTQCNTI